MDTISPFIDSNIDNVMSRLYQLILKFINIPERHLVDTLLHDSQTLYLVDRLLGTWGPQISTDEIYQLFFIYFNVNFAWSVFPS